MPLGRSSKHLEALICAISVGGVAASVAALPRNAPAYQFNERSREAKNISAH